MVAGIYDCRFKGQEDERTDRERLVYMGTLHRAGNVYIVSDPVGFPVEPEMGFGSMVRFYVWCFETIKDQCKGRGEGLLVSRGIYICF